MLGLSFQLTPKQTSLLVEMRAGLYHSADAKSVGVPGAAGYPDIVTSLKSLGRKGLISHDTNRDPTFLLTKEGEAIADLIVNHAKKIVSMMQDKRDIVPTFKRWEERYQNASQELNQTTEGTVQP